MVPYIEAQCTTLVKAPHNIEFTRVQKVNFVQMEFFESPTLTINAWFHALILNAELLKIKIDINSTRTQKTMMCADGFWRKSCIEF